MLKRCHRVSVVVRTRDIEKHFRELLWRLSRQTLHPSELVVVDNFSSKRKLDEMVNLLLLAQKNFFSNQICVKLVPITNREFSHAYSTNVGVFVASCDLVCITNGHSLPISEMWLESGVTHFRDVRVAGVAGYSSPHEDGSVWEKLGYEWGWKRPNELSGAYIRDDFFSTVNCVLRRSLWEEYPFDEKLPSEVRYARRFGGEDYDWAKEMLARGYKVIVEPKFDVYHSHGETFSRLVSKYLIWRQIRKKVKSFKRPRKSYTRLESVKPLYYDL
ncbi:glycosyltransferase [Candidatus Bathyarchaeota archaeon]|nr:glycosyltransferase [Candidatus Bathyarchaeota archaeon]